ncbi:MAG TPA: D-Ala-D-Ala carboxypeptidase family metallohydrolase [Longimicrobiaceae bacterium]|nr:D-Ala-D-Ala carboxypeptidase family metallohydrolase [Longimicrobiaceae bacterium]
MSDSPEAAGTDARLEEILERLAALERLVIAERVEVAETSEGTEKDQPEAGGLVEAGRRPRTRAAPSLAERLELFIDGLGFPNFKGKEFTPYWSRERKGVKNSPPPEELWPNLVPTLAVLQRFRTEFGKPVHLLSTYRSPAYNKAVGGEKGSKHMEFLAIDFMCTLGKPSQWAALLKSYRGKKFRNPHTGSDFTFRGGIGIYPVSGFVHVDTRGNDANWIIPPP